MFLNRTIQRECRKHGFFYDVFLDGKDVGHICLEADDETGTVIAYVLQDPDSPSKHRLFKIDPETRRPVLQELKGKVEFFRRSWGLKHSEVEQEAA